MTPRRRMVRPSVLRHRGVDRLGPPVDAAGEVDGLVVPLLAEELDGVAAAAARAAVDDDVGLLGELAEAVRQGAERDLDRSRQVADRPLVGLADVYERDLVAPIALCFQFLDGDRGNAESKHRQKIPNPGMTRAADAATIVNSSVTRDGGVYDLGVAVDSAGEVSDLAEAGLAEELDGLRAAPSGLAVDHDVVGRGELVQVLGKGPEGDLDGLREGADRELVRLPHVHEDERSGPVAQRLQLLDADLRNAVGGGGGLRLDPAEGLIVHELRHGRVWPADDALGVLAELQLSEAHGERVHEEEPSDQRVAGIEDQLDRLGRLDHSQEPRQDPEDSPFRAGRDEPRRRRLGIEAAIARPLLRPED